METASAALSFIRFTPKLPKEQYGFYSTTYYVLLIPIDVHHWCTFRNIKTSKGTSIMYYLSEFEEQFRSGSQHWNVSQSCRFLQQLRYSISYLFEYCIAFIYCFIVCIWQKGLSLSLKANRLQKCDYPYTTTEYRYTGKYFGLVITLHCHLLHLAKMSP